MNSSTLRSWVAACRMTPLAKWLAFLAAVATVAGVQAALFPRWPKAQPLPQQRLLASFENTDSEISSMTLPTKERQASRSQNVARSETLAFRFADGEELRMLRGVARERGSFTLKTFTTNRPELNLKGGSLDGSPPRMEGRIQGRPARQTCVVALSPKAQGFGVNESELAPLVDRAAQGKAAALQRFLGLQENRNYSCILISLRSGSSRPVSADRWNRLLQVVPDALLPQASAKAATTSRNPS
jgi:hypothetical protein